jgi:hypothetical protein
MHFNRPETMIHRTSKRRMTVRWTRVLRLFAVLASAAPIWAQAPVGVTKIRGDIYQHQRLKGPAPGRALVERRALARSHRLDANDLDREEVVLYVHERLSEVGIAELRAQGIDVKSEHWPGLRFDLVLGYEGQQVAAEVPSIGRSAISVVAAPGRKWSRSRSARTTKSLRAASMRGSTVGDRESLRFGRYAPNSKSSASRNAGPGLFSWRTSM